VKRDKAWTNQSNPPLQAAQANKFVVALAEPHHGSASFSKLRKPTTELSRLDVGKLS
jgi:hypothetical protein